MPFRDTPLYFIESVRTNGYNLHRMAITCAILVFAAVLPFTSCTQQQPEATPIPAAWEGELLALGEDSLTIYNAEDGQILVPAEVAPLTEDSLQGMQPDEVWGETTAPYVGRFTLSETVAMDDGSIGTLQIPRVGLTVSVHEAEDTIEAMTHGVAHMPETSAWNGHVAIAGHNRGANTYFGRIHELVPGDTITYTTAQGARTYQVTGSLIIDHMDWSHFNRTNDNRLTLLTCIDNKPTQRLIVQAVETT